MEALTQAQYLTFGLSGEEYGIPVLCVKEIVKYARVNPVPGTPTYISGVIGLRGCVVPVVDLGAKFGLGPSHISPRSCIVFVEVMLGKHPASMGILVDSVNQVVEMGADQIESTPSFGTKVRVDYLRGLGRVGKRLVPLLDLNHVMSTDEILSATQVGDSALEFVTGETGADRLELVKT